MNILDIEHAAFASCPAMEQSSVPGFTIRSNGGYTKRANSANQLVNTTTDLENIIANCESYFRNRKLPSIFRLLSVCDNDSLDRALADKGYQYVEKSYVMTQPAKLSKDVGHKIEQLTAKDWINSFYQLSSDSNIFKQHHLQMIKSISAQHFTAAQRDRKGNIAALGIGVVENGYFGIFNIVSSKVHQRQGFSQLLISGLMNWACSVDAHTAYVQVRAANTPAVTLYKKLGYSEQYHYWYRVREENNA